MSAPWFAAESFEQESPEWQDKGLRSHQRLAARLAQYAEGKALYVDGAGWHFYDGTRWAPDAREAFINKLLTDLLKVCWAESMADRDLAQDVRASMTATGSAGVVALASRQLFAAQTDAKPWLLNCSNGTLDLHSLTLRPHDPADYITKVTNAAYVPGAASSTWADFLKSSLPKDEVRRFLQRYAGMALIGRVIEHVLVIATGSGRNGKGILAGAISNALGDYSVTASNDLLIAGRYGHKSAGELAAQMVLRGARWAVMSELNKGDRMDESTMKNLTGGDNITAKFMGQNMVEFAPSHTFFMQTNDLPTVDADAKAAWARIRVVPFDVSFIGREDPTLKERLEAEADAVLTWAVEGLREYQNIGLAAPESVLKTTEQYHQENDSLARFISEQCIVHPAASVAKGRLAAAYTEWAKENGEDAMTAKAIGSRLKQTKGIRETNSGSRGWSGIGMAATEENGSDMGKQHKQQIYPEILTGNEYRKPPGTSVVSVAHDFAPALCLVCGDALDDNEHEHHLECAA